MEMQQNYGLFADRQGHVAKRSVSRPLVSGRGFEAAAISPR
ncbi:MULTISPECIES: hypothetical protein [Bradyrhizobium]